MSKLTRVKKAEKKTLSAGSLKKALDRQRMFGGKIGSNLLALGLLEKEQLSDFFSFFPKVPKTIEETSVEPDFISDLILKHALILKSFTLPKMAHQVRLPQAVVKQSLDELRQLGLAEITRGDISFNIANYRYTITGSGMTRALSLLDECRYVGPAPVSLDDYRNAVEIQTIRAAKVTMADIKKAFSDLVVAEHYLKVFGAAVNSGKPMFLYGPPGNGKTSIAEAIGRSLQDKVFVPYSVVVGGQVIVVYDEVNHEKIEDETFSESHDQRWVKVKRPIVVTGGELTLENLDLRFNSLSKYYEAPLHMKANNGMFILDDFGRQMVEAETLLNRWIVPLDHRADYLTLHTGMKFEIPFDQFIIFATNLAPTKMVDEAFLRRLRFKIKIEHPTMQEYEEIFQNVCSSNGLEYDPKALQYLMTKYHQANIQPNGCHPRDIIDHIIDEAHYLGKPAQITKEAIDKAWGNYFVHD